MSKKRSEKLGQLIDVVLDKCAVLAFVCVFVIMIIVSGGVIARYFFRMPLSWVLDISLYLMLYICFLSAAYILKRERHVIMEVGISRLSPKMQALLNFLTSCLMIGMCLVITWYGAGLTIEYFQRDAVTHDSLEWPKFLLIGIIPIGMFLLFMQTLRRALGYLGQLRKVQKERTD